MITDLKRSLKHPRLHSQRPQDPDTSGQILVDRIPPSALYEERRRQLRARTRRSSAAERFSVALDHHRNTAGPENLPYCSISPTTEMRVLDEGSRKCGA